MYFSGQFPHAIDARGRVAIPALYRHAFAAGAFMRPGPEGCVELYPTESFEAETERRLEAAAGNRSLSARRIRRYFLADAYPVDLDAQGRILLPAQVRAAVPLDGRTVIIGCGDYLELWDPDRWDAERAALERVEADADGAEAAR